jgi:uncharacterized repeat protein (TIGR01451 family)
MILNPHKLSFSASVKSRNFKWLNLFTIFFLLTAGLATPSNMVFAQPTALSAPVLLVTNGSYPANPFGAYLGEILRAEGLNEFDQADLSSLTPSLLAQYPVVILAETTLTAAQASLFTSYETGGGKLIAMRPDPQIASLFGLATQANGSPQSDGYLKIDPAVNINGEAPGLGLVTETLQIHGPVSLFSPAAGSTVVAWLYSNATDATLYPAVVGATSGTGQGVAFTYDLARNVVYTRQGNPANANLDVDNDGVVRTIDLFQKTGGGAGWVDLNKVSIPQADVQQRLFARLVKELANKTEPLPQLWYFPGNAMSMLIMTGDAHANPYQPPNDYYQVEINSLNQHSGQMTMGLSIGDGPTCSQIQTWMSQGNTFGLHPYAYHPDLYPPFFVKSLVDGFKIGFQWFQVNFGINTCQIPLSKAVRNHQGAWAGWTDAADYAVNYGVSMDTSFYTWGPWLQKSDGSWAHGYITGSGQPMKFVRSDGSIIPVYQQATQLVDEQLVLQTDSSLEGLSGNNALIVAQKLMDNSLQGGYAALTTQNDVDFYKGQPQIWAEGMMDYAQSKAIPVWNADKWVNFITNRHDAYYSDLTWDNSKGILSFSLNSTSGSQGDLTTLLPLKNGIFNLDNVMVDGSPVSINQTNVQDVNVGFITISPGSHHFVVTYLPCSGNASLAIATSYNTTSLIAGNPLSYTLVTNNHGPDAAVNTKVVDLLPVGIKFVNVLSDPLWSCTYTENTNIVSCNDSTAFNPSKTSTISINISTPLYPGTLVNKVNVTSANCDLTHKNIQDTLAINTLYGLYLPVIHQ